MSTGKVVLGILAGIAAGVAWGILFAPDKGTSARKKIAKKGDDYVEEIEAKFNDLISGISQKYETVKEKTVQLAENGKAILDEKLHGKRKGNSDDAL